MDDSKKRKLSARQIVFDIRSGMDSSRLKRKYVLSEKELQTVIRKLVSSGALREDEASARLLPSRATGGSNQPGGNQAQWRCPACHAAHDREVEECPVCGVMVARFVSRQSASDPAARIRSTPSPKPHDAGWSPWTYGAVTVMIAAVLGGGLFFWSGNRDAEKPKIASPSTVSEMPGGVSDPTAGRGEAGATAEADGNRTGSPTQGRTDDPIEGTYLQFSPKGLPLGLSVSQGSALHLFETPGPNQEFKKLPPDTGAKRYYDEFRIAGSTYLVITEESNPPLFYLDANGNGDFTDDEGPFSGERPGIVPNHYTLLLPYKGEESGVPYRIWLFPSRMGGVKFYPQCHWYGELVVNDKSYNIVLFDANSDGDYSNDPLVIDVDNDGKAAETEMLKAGQSCNIDGTAVKLIAIAPSGRWVRLDF